MRIGWKRTKINDVALVGDGAHASIKRKDSGVMYFTSKNFDINGLKLNKVDYISEEDFKKYFNANSKALTKPKKNDVLLSIIGTMGAPYLVNGDIEFGLSSSVSILRPRPEVIDSKFLYYWIKSEYFQKSIDSIKSGVAQSFLSLGMIRSLPCILPLLKTQHRIASILSGYDDLIENNLKRIKLLEEQAQQTYEEWFVRFKFPGYENAKFDEVNGLPVGWKNGKLSDLINFQSGFAYKSAQFKEEGFSVIKIKNIGNNTINTENTNFIDEEYASKTLKFKLNPGDLLIAMTGATVGKVGVVPITDKACYLNQRVGRFVSLLEVDNSTFINCFFNIGNGLHHILNIAGGAAQPNISASQILSIETIAPELEMLKKFSCYAINISKSILNLQTQNQLLKEARDLLLPRLMSGMIDVDGLGGGR